LLIISLLFLGTESQARTTANVRREDFTCL